MIFQNEFMIKIFGNCLGKKCFEAYANNKEICPNCPSKLCLQDGRTHSLIRPILNPDGEKIIIETIANPIIGMDGKVISILELSRNITKEKEVY